MTEPHIDSRPLTLTTPGGLTSEVTVRALTALQLFDYQTYLADVEWPDQPPEGDAKATHKYTLRVQKVIYELNVTMAAFGLHYLNPADTLDQARQRVMTSYPLPDHVMRLAMAVKALSGLVTPAPSVGESQEDEGETKEPADPKKA